MIMDRSVLMVFLSNTRENTASCAIQVQVLVIVILCRSLVAHRDIHCMCILLCINIVETNIVNAHAAIL